MNSMHGWLSSSFGSSFADEPHAVTRGFASRFSNHQEPWRQWRSFFVPRETRRQYGRLAIPRLNQRQQNNEQ
jgi:hypothetical protein